MSADFEQCQRPATIRTLDAVSAKLTTEALIALNTSVEGNRGVDPDEAAAQWIKDNGFDRPLPKQAK